jgi:hypothetical protein
LGRPFIREMSAERKTENRRRIEILGDYRNFCDVFLVLCFPAEVLKEHDGVWLCQRLSV